MSFLCIKSYSMFDIRTCLVTKSMKLNVSDSIISIKRNFNQLCLSVMNRYVVNASFSLDKAIIYIIYTRSSSFYISEKIWTQIEKSPPSLLLLTKWFGCCTLPSSSFYEFKLNTLFNQQGRLFSYLLYLVLLLNRKFGDLNRILFFLPADDTAAAFKFVALAA